MFSRRKCMQYLGALAPIGLFNWWDHKEKRPEWQDKWFGIIGDYYSIVLERDVVDSIAYVTMKVKGVQGYQGKDYVELEYLFETCASDETWHKLKEVLAKHYDDIVNDFMPREVSCCMHDAYKWLEHFNHIYPTPEEAAKHPSPRINLGLHTDLKLFLNLVSIDFKGCI